MKKIAILTSGGDAPGMNNAVRAIAKHAKANNLEAYLVYEGYKGLYNNQIIPADSVDLDAYINHGGTFIYSARFPEFKEASVREVAINNLKKLGIEALVVIGGDGSYKGAQLLHEAGVKTIGLPGTIDNDIAATDYTIGYDTALNTIVDAIDKIRDTAKSHQRIMIVEVMGNGCGDLALYSGLATGAEIIATNQYKLPEDQIAATALELTKQPGRRSIIIVVSEKCYDIKKLEKQVQETTGWDTRSNPLNHIQRGGTPSAQERILASLLGQKAVDFLLEGKSGISVGIIKNDIVGIPILEALSMVNESKNKFVQKAIKFNKLNQSK
ncbi:6-phosphofructokinase [Mycoplasmopsis bovirhinis]|uniref:ATP-dependent 6-phosphofructokinase n=1 Tax=Mycoplasmopsis bovirhinis TaxID=29553 RepID=A0A449ACG6_9BACT|nr:6-phosphofructokinase [Mycoplasmopsis bovirhinis]VEU62623.1 6-phosphofructokinase [Mycoplasmopsis bovirhinis]